MQISYLNFDGCLFLIRCVASVFYLGQTLKRLGAFHPVNISIARDVTGVDHVAAIGAEARVDMGLLNVHAAAVLAQGARSVKAVAVPFPQANDPAAVSYDE